MLSRTMVETNILVTIAISEITEIMAETIMQVTITGMHIEDSATTMQKIC